MSGYLNSAGVIHSVKPDLEQIFNCSARQSAWLTLLRKTPVEIFSSRGPKYILWIFTFYYDKKLISWCKNQIFVSKHNNRGCSVLFVSLKRCDLRNWFILKSITFPSGKLFSQGISNQICHYFFSFWKQYQKLITAYVDIFLEKLSWPYFSTCKTNFLQPKSGFPASSLQCFAFMQLGEASKSPSYRKGNGKPELHWKDSEIIWTQD